MKTTHNLLAKLGIAETDIDARIQQAFHTIFKDEAERFYFPMEPDAGYMIDTGNFNARTEGMSYGMMMAVQMDRKEIFDRLWVFSKRYMYNPSGLYEGYFAWSVQPDGKRNSDGPAPDGEEGQGSRRYQHRGREGRLLDPHVPYLPMVPKRAPRELSSSRAAVKSEYSPVTTSARAAFKSLAASSRSAISRRPRW